MAVQNTSLWVAGIDEAGRGPLAGPVTAACVCLPTDYCNPEINDSKLLRENKRDMLYDEIISHALAYSVVSVGHHRIDQINILQATKLAMRLSAKRVNDILEKKFGGAQVYYLVDGNARISNTLPHETIIKGDQKLQAIAAASILAKVTRDRLMNLLDSYYPDYGFKKHKGYPTAAHQQSIREVGPSRVHRRTFAGVREMVLFIPMSADLERTGDS